MLNINYLIDHTNLKITANEKDIEKLCEEATVYNFRGVCVNPLWIPFSSEYLKDKEVKIISVCDFPLGSSSTEIRKKETELIIKTGAEEIDLVMQISLLKSKKYKGIEKDIREIVNIAHPNVTLKVIIEAPMLSDDEIITATKIAESAGADYIKSGTGTNGPVTINQIKIIKKTTNLPIKAAGGIKSTNMAVELLNAGAAILGSSNSIEIVEGKKI
jgi:deoxyribose-phosphate aldolase